MLMHQDVTDTTPWGPADEPALVCAEACFDQVFHYWRGASGRRYLHSVYTLIGCPALPRANYILVRRHDNGSRTTRSRSTLLISAIRAQSSAPMRCISTSWPKPLRS